MPGESFENPCVCVPINGGVSPTLQPYVVSVNGLKGILTIAAGGGVAISSVGNSILIAADGSAGLGTVTTVDATSSNSNLVVTGGPVTTVGTFAFSLAGNLNSISGLTMAADQMLYSTGPGVFVATSLTAFGRSLIDDANATAARSTLGLVIGTNVQAYSSDLDAFVSNASWSGADLTLAGSLTIATSLTVSGGGFITTDFGIGGDLTVIGAVSAGAITATSVSGNGSGLTNLSASSIVSGTLTPNLGGTGLVAYTIGDLIYASGGTTLSKLADVAAGAFLRSGGVATAPVWSTTLWPNTLTTGDILYASSATQVSRLANVATGNALLSGGVGVASAFGKVTSSHVNNTIPTMSGGTTSDLTGFDQQVSFSETASFSLGVNLFGPFSDNSNTPGNSGDILTSTGSGTAWSNQVFLSTLRIDTLLSSEATITAPGVTGAQTINKMTGTVRFAAAASSLVVTNNLATTSTRVLATVCSNDTTAYVKNVTVTTGSFTIVLGAAATAETEVFWELRGLT